jgi:hypothetical protein
MLICQMFFGEFMKLWLVLWDNLSFLRPAFNRKRTFLWFTTCIIGIIVRKDMAGVTSIVRSLGLRCEFYDRLLDFFHSNAVNRNLLAKLWTKLVITTCGDLLLRHNGRLIVLGDGIKAPKCGKKMPGVKKLHQQSESNTKPPFIYGHSCQAIALVAGALETFFAIPLVSKIHEGVVFTNRDKRTLLDKMMNMIKSVVLTEPYYFIADAYYASKTTINHLVKDGHNHLITRVRSNAVGFSNAELKKGKTRGRKAIYGKKILLRKLFDDNELFSEINSPVYGEKNIKIQYRFSDLYWRSTGRMVRFVAVKHPIRGSIILMTTDLSLNPADVIRLYGIRFKIEVSFKQAVYTIGTYAYHFFMPEMAPRKNKSGNQYVHMKSREYRQAIVRKLRAYHCHLLVGCIAHGLVQILSLKHHKLIWNVFGSWIRTIRPGVLPSEQVVTIAMKNTLSEFLLNSDENQIFVNFIRPKIDIKRAEGAQLLA